MEDMYQVGQEGTPRKTQCRVNGPQERTVRIRVAEHPLEIHLLFAVGTRLLLSHNAPAANAELMETKHHWSREILWTACVAPSSVLIFKVPRH